MCVNVASLFFYVVFLHSFAIVLYIQIFFFRVKYHMNLVWRVCCCCLFFVCSISLRCRYWHAIVVFLLLALLLLSLLLLQHLLLLKYIFRLFGIIHFCVRALAHSFCRSLSISISLTLTRVMCFVGFSSHLRDRTLRFIIVYLPTHRRVSILSKNDDIIFFVSRTCTRKDDHIIQIKSHKKTTWLLSLSRAATCARALVLSMCVCVVVCRFLLSVLLLPTSWIFMCSAQAVCVRMSPLYVALLLLLFFFSHYIFAFKTENANYN